MKSIEIRLESEKKQVLSVNNDVVIDNNIQAYIASVNSYLSDIYKGNLDLDELAENYLTPTMVLIGKIEKLINIIKEANIDEYRIAINFEEGIDHGEFSSYFNFQDIEDIDISLHISNTTSLFNKYQKSVSFNGVYLLHQELYEHEDDTDYSLYYIIIKK